jgi:glycosyltransferase involved in cell wall biosynthesis
LPTVTVGLSFRNDRSTLLDAIRSVLAQDLADFELLLVDDGSTDGSLDLARSLTDSRIRIISDGNNQKLAARLNQVASAARAPLVARMDADDLMHPARLAKQVARFRADPALNILGTGAYTIDEFSKVRGFRGSTPLNFEPLKVLRHGLFIHPTVMMRSEWARKYTYDERLARVQDLDLWLRVAGLPGVSLLPELLHFYREPSTPSIATYLESNRIKKDVLARHGPVLVGPTATMLLRADVDLRSIAYRMAILPRLRAQIMAYRSQPLTGFEAAEAQAAVDRVLSFPLTFRKKPGSPRVTVGIPFFNSEKTLASAIRSVFAQSLTDWELLLVDDGSTDASLRVARQIDDPRVRVFSDNKNLKLAARLNQISREARSALVARMDADDLMHPDRLLRQVEYLEQQPHVDLLGTAAISIDGLDRPQGVRGLDQPPSSPLSLLSKGLFIHPSVMARTAWMRANPYSLDYVRAEDFELWVRTFKKATVRLLEEPLLFYRETVPLNLSAYLHTQEAKRRVLFTSGAALVGWPTVALLAASSQLKELAFRLVHYVGADSRLIRLRNRETPRELHNRFSELLARIEATPLPGVDKSPSGMAGDV